MKIDPLRWKSCPHYLQCKRRIFLSHRLQFPNNLAVQKITVTTALRHILVNHLSHQPVIHSGKEFLYRAFIPRGTNRQNDLVSSFPAFIQLQYQRRILLQICLFGNCAVACAYGQSRQKCRMFAKISGQTHTDYIRVLLTNPVHDIPGIILGSVIYKDNFVFPDLSQNLLFHIRIQHFQCIGIIIYRYYD